MSLNAAERDRTASELAENYRLSGLSPDEACDALGFTRKQLTDTLGMQPGIDPADVWALRDLLELRATARGENPVSYSVLTEDARRAASAWFNLR
jgi:hypothetical protein